MSYLTDPKVTHQNDELISEDILSNYNKLNKIIDQVNHKVQHVIDKHQNQFLFAYRNHVKRIKKQLNEIKKKSEDQQKMFSSNDRIKFLEKQIIVFREQSLQLYDKLQKTSGELQKYRKKYENVYNQLQSAQATVRESIKTSKNLQKGKSFYIAKIEQLEKQLEEKNRQIQKLKEKSGKISKLGASIPKKTYYLSSLASDRSGNTRYNQSMNKSESFMRKSLRAYSSLATDDNEFKNSFFQCLNSVKKQIAYRKGAQINPKQIKDISQFRQIDKIRVIQMFFSNPKVQTFLYEKMFPDSFFQNKIESQKDKNETKILFMLPKVKGNNDQQSSNIGIL